jgi:hypothetical protein
MQVEYLYARRPILFLGYGEGIAAQFVSERERCWFGFERSGADRRPAAGVDRR